MPPKTYVRDYMSSPVKTLQRNQVLSMADAVMRNERIRHLPILDEDGRLAGILSQRDLFFSALLRALGYGSHARDQRVSAIPAKEAMSEPVVTTTPDTAIATAAQMMVDRKIGCLPVLEGDALVGIVSESDIVAAVARGDLRSP